VEEAYGRSIQLYLVDGTPNGLIIASIHGWTGTVLVSSQATFPKLLARPEVDRTGLYILFGLDPANPLSMRAYIGEADSVKDRIVNSAAERGFWETALVITTSDEALTKGHVRYLEARLINAAETAGRVLIDNLQKPSADKRRLPEADRANMEAFLANLRVLLPVVGLELLKPRAATSISSAMDIKVGQATFELRHWSEVRATGIEEDGEFIVLQGSQALKNGGYQSANSYGELKQELISQAILTSSEDEKFYMFARPYAFKSPSAAAAVVLDRNANGRQEWKVIGTKLTYHQWQQEKITVSQPEDSTTS